MCIKKKKKLWDIAYCNFLLTFYSKYVYVKYFISPMLMDILLYDFECTLRKCRCKETSGDPEKRSDKNPSYRQCLFTALLANEVLWLSFCSEKVTLGTGLTHYHYFNKDTSGNIYRFCEEQFQSEIIIQRTEEKIRSNERRDTFLSMYPHIRAKYQLLKDKFQTEIQR